MCWSEWAGGRDLFTPIVALEETHALFQRTVEGPGHAAARRLMREVFANLRDIDTNFVREFQTSGFSARVFELALFAYLQEQGCSLERTQTAPDFVLLGDSSAAIEVTTTNPPQDVVDTDGSSQVSADGAIPDDKAFIFQIGKALRRKLLKRDAQGRAYWELPHVEGIPFVIAVGAFHEQHAQIYPMGLVGQYLYGNLPVAKRDKNGHLLIDVEPIDEHHFENRTIPSGLFAQPEAEDLSGVIFSNAHTVAMFNRIGYERGYGDPTVAMCRVGWAIDPNPNASQPQKFGYVVGDRPPEDLETFSEGLHLFINPWARNQLSPDTLPAITYHEHIDDGQTLSTNRGGLQPLVSKTYIFEGENAPLYARYHQLKFLDLVPPLPKSDT